jgi:Lon protease-like protein
VTTTYDQLPIFPLPRLVLMPGTLMPLHVFEPRYRAMVEHCASGTGLMGVATLQPGGESELESPALIYPEIGVGRLVRVKPFPDGRSNIVLEYVQTARLVQELPTALPFRLVDARGHTVEQDAIERPIRELRRLLNQLGMMSPDIGDELTTLSKLADLELMDDLAVRLLRDQAARRRYTVLGRLSDRGDALVEQLAISLASMSAVVGDA